VGGIFFQEVVKIPLRIVMGRGKVLGEKDLDCERLRKCGYHLFAGLGDGVDLALRQVQSKKEGNARHINQGNDNKVDKKSNIISRSIFHICFCSS